MKWSYILFLPAAISMAWAVAALLFKRKLTSAQVLLAIVQGLLAVAISMMAVYFRGHSGVLFIYDYFFESFSVLALVLFYIGICSLTEPRGVSRGQRLWLIVPLVHIAGLTVGGFLLGWRGYNALCHNLSTGQTAFAAADPVYNFMLFWDHWLFPMLIVAVGVVLLIVSARKVWVYQRRFNSYYAADMGARFIDSRIIIVIAAAFLPLGALTIWAVDFRPYLYKYWLIVLSALLSAIQMQFGYFVYKSDYDALFLTRYIRSKENI